MSPLAAGILRWVASQAERFPAFPKQRLPHSPVGTVAFFAATLGKAIPVDGALPGGIRLMAPDALAI
jgi:hypothetical protein